jgi:hypothetical protein
MLRAIEFHDPPRVPVTYCNRDFAASDALGTGAYAAANFVPSAPGMTEWGYAWHSLDRTMGQPATHPLADPAAIEVYCPPDPYAPGRHDHVPAWTAANRDRFLRYGVGITGFNQATFLRGFPELLEDLVSDPARAARVLDFVFDFEHGLIEQAVQFDVDCLAFADDWGTQDGLMINPALWRDVFRPRYAAQFARVHAAGKKVWFHTCGNVWAIIPDLIDIGVDVLELLQPDIFGVERLGAAFRGQVCFCCSVDHQRVASTGTRDEIFAYVRRLVDHLATPHGGFIGYVEDYASLGMPECNYQWIREAFATVGR